MKTQELTPQQIKNETQLKELTLEYQKLRLIITERGFIQEWYKLTKTNITGLVAFNDLNNFYFENTKNYRFKDYNVFLNRIKSIYNN